MDESGLMVEGIAATLADKARLVMVVEVAPRNSDVETVILGIDQAVIAVIISHYTGVLIVELAVVNPDMVRNAFILSQTLLVGLNGEAVRVAQHHLRPVGEAYDFVLSILVDRDARHGELDVAYNDVGVTLRTVKGKGYKIAEGQHEHWHGVGPFNIADGVFIKKEGPKVATAVFADALIDLANKYENIVGVTAAMPSGTGINKLMEKFPDRFWDVAIAEQHAITSMAAMAKEGFKPYITIYSTFLQRGFDQIIHDVCLMNLPVVFAMDRAGMVGNDGETHQGVFDISFLRFIPNMILFAPRDNETLIQGLEFAYTLTSPSAIRYPRGYFKELVYNSTPFTLGKAELLKDGSSNKLFIGYGAGVSRAIETESLYEEDIAILDLRFVKPIDKDILVELSKKYDNWYVFSDSQKQGGVASAILEVLNEKRIHNVEVTSFEYDDSFIEHGETKQVEESLGLLPEQLVLKVK